jgi:Cytochrome P460
MRRAGLAALAAALLLPLAGASAGPELIAYPAAYASWPVFGIVDRPDIKAVRTYFVNPDALARAKPGAPAPHGTILVMEVRKAKLDMSGNPETDMRGRFVKTDEVTAVNVQAKGAGWGAAYPPEKRNGEWEYASFKADGSRPDGAKFDACFSCHLNRADERDYTFVFGKYLIDRK